MNSIKDIVNKLYKKYDYLNLSEKEFYQLIEPSLNNLTVSSLNEKELLKLINKNIKKYIQTLINNSDEKILIILDKYLTKNIQFTQNSNSNLSKLKKLSIFFTQSDENINIDLLRNFLQTNKTVANVLANIINKKQHLIQTNQLEEIDSSVFLITILEIYCLINNIEITQENDLNQLNELLSNEIRKGNDYYISDTLKSYINAINKPLLSKDETRRLFIEMSKGNMEARKLLIERNLRLVVSFAKRYYNCNIEFIDLIQEGNIGLIKALDKFDLSKGVEFSTYAIWWIRQSINRAIDNQSRTIRIPKHVCEQLKKIKREQNNLMYKLNREPTIEEIANVIGCSKDQIDKVLQAEKVIISGNSNISDDSEEEFFDLIASEDADDDIKLMMQQEVRNLLANSNLTENEKLVITLRYGIGGIKPLLLKEIAPILNVKFQRIEQIEKAALNKLVLAKNTSDLVNYLDNKNSAVKNLEQKRENIKVKRKVSKRKSA